MLPSKKVQFTQDFTPRGQDQPSYVKDQVIDLETSYAEKYERKGYCIILGAGASGGAAVKVPDPVLPAPQGPKFDVTVAIANDWRTGLKPMEQMDLAKKLGAKGVNSGAIAVAAITDALFERVQPIELRTEQNGEERKVFALKPWPAYAAFANELIRQPGEGLEVHGDDVAITVANGIADYVIVAEARDAVVVALVESTFEEPPPAPDAK